MSARVDRTILAKVVIKRLLRRGLLTEKSERNFTRAGLLEAVSYSYIPIPMCVQVRRYGYVKHTYASFTYFLAPNDIASTSPKQEQA